MKLWSTICNLWSKIESWLRQVLSWLRREWFGIKPISAWIVPLMMNLWSKIESWLRQAWSWLRREWFGIKPIGSWIVNTPFIFMTATLGLLLLVHFLAMKIPCLDYILVNLGLHKDKAGYIIGSLLGFAALLFGLHLRNKQLEQGREQLDTLIKQNLEERYTRSIALIGNKELHSRLSGIADLERLLSKDVEVYERGWERLKEFLNNPPELEGWVTTQKDGELFCRKEQKEDSWEWSETDEKIGKRPDIEKITKIIQERGN